MPPPKRSPVWDHFTNVNGQITCKECSTEVKARFGNTSNLKRHLENKHVETYKRMKLLVDAKPKDKNSFSSECRQLKLEESLERKDKLLATSVRAKTLTHTIAMMICVDLQPYNIVEDLGFKLLMKTLEPRFVLPTRQFLSSTVVPTLYLKKKEIIMERFSSGHVSTVCFTTDAWTSRSNDSFLSLTAHYISEDMKMVSLCLAVKPFPSSHTANNLELLISEIIEEYKVPEKTTLYMISDNGRNFVKGISNLDLESRTCFAHTLQLVISDSLKEFSGIQKILAKGRSITGHFKRSTLATSVLLETQKEMKLSEHKLVQDVSTRWNSTYYMLKRLVEQKNAISVILASNEKVSSFSAHEWKTATQLVNALKPFEKVTEIMSGEKYPTASMIIPALHQLEEALENNTELKDLCNVMLGNIRKRWPGVREDKIFSLATFLDPRFKLVGFSENERSRTIQCVSDLCSELFQEENPQATEKLFELTQQTKKNGDDDFWKSFQLKASDEYAKMSSSMMVRSEIDNYLIQATKPIQKYHEALFWWKENQNSYPNLSKLARRFLCVTATSVPSERVFSKAGNVMTTRRCSLKSKNLEKIVFLNQNWDIE